MGGGKWAGTEVAYRALIGPSCYSPPSLLPNHPHHGSAVWRSSSDEVFSEKKAIFVPVVVFESERVVHVSRQ